MGAPTHSWLAAHQLRNVALDAAKMKTGKETEEEVQEEERSEENTKTTAAAGPTNA